MQRVNERECSFREGDWGVKYLMRGPRIDWGVVLLKTGQSLGVHGHREVEETFYILTGRPKVVLDEAVYEAEPGDAFRVEPGEVHDIINDGPEETKIVFIKCPYLPEDKFTP